MISVIIVSYNTREILRDCLLSVQREDAGAEVVVVDNNSTDGTIEMIEKEFPQVKLVKNNFNAGFSAANNQGIKITSGEYVLLLNPDTILKPNSLQSLKNAIAAHPGCIIGPALLNTDGSLQISAWRYPSVLKSLAELFYLHIKLNVSGYPNSFFDTEAECDFISGAAMFFERNILNELKGLDETLFWMEDVDFCYRANKNGIKTWYYPQAKIVHLGGQSSSKNYKKAIANQLLSRLKFTRKNYSVFSFVLLDIVVFLHIVTRIIAFSILFVFTRTPKAAAYIYTMKRYFKYAMGDKSIA